MNEIYQKALEKIPVILDATDNVEKTFQTVFSEVKNVMPYNVGFVFYFNADGLNLQYESKNINFPKNVTISESFREKILNSEFFEFDNKSKFSKELQLEDKTNYFVILPLLIQGVVFGCILFGRDEKFSKSDLNVLKAFTAVCAYAIKDAELADIFKMQSKILQKNVEETSIAYGEIEQANKKIVEENKIKNEVLANISHELRTPLNAIIGFSEILKSEHLGQLTNKQAHCVNDIQVSSIHLLGMINEILDISKIESNMLKFSPNNVDFSLLLSETVNIIAPLALKKNVKITTKTDIKSSYWGDYQKLQQILFNLLSNSIKFTPKDGYIEVCVSEDLDNFTLSVKDNGIGIDKKHHEEIFSKFVQIENDMAQKESSTGLGLTITKELVKLHQGEITLESKLNEGAKFIIKLPKLRID